MRTRYIETALRPLNSSDRELSQSLLYPSKHRPAGCFQHIKYSFKERRKKQAYRLCSVKIINMRFSNILSAFLLMNTITASPLLGTPHRVSVRCPNFMASNPNIWMGPNINGKCSWKLGLVCASLIVGCVSLCAAAVAQE